MEPTLIKAISCTVTSVVLGTMAWISKIDAQVVDTAVKILTGIGSVCTAFFACRYYIIAARKKK